MKYTPCPDGEIAHDFGDDREMAIVHFVDLVPTSGPVMNAMQPFRRSDGTGLPALSLFLRALGAVVFVGSLIAMLVDPEWGQYIGFGVLAYIWGSLV